MVRNAFKNYKKEMLVTIFLSVINSLTKGVSIVMLIPMLNIINIKGTDIGVFSFAINLFSSLPYGERVAVLLLVYVLLMLFTSALSRFMAIYNTKFVQKYVKQLRLNVYNAVLDADWEVLTAQKHDDLLNSFTNETAKISKALMVFPAIISVIITALTQIAIALTLNVTLTVIVIVVGSTFFFAFRRFFDIARKDGERMRLANRKYLSEIRMQLVSIKEIKSYGVEEFHKDLLHEVLDEYEAANIKRTRMSTLPTILFSMSSTILIAIIFYIANVIMKVEMMELVLIVYIFSKIWPIFSRLHNQIQTINNALPFFYNVDKTMEILDSTEKEQGDVSGHIDLKKEINYKNVTFSYAYSNEKVLNNTSFTIKANTITALNGKSGVGKSTIVNLLMGLLKPIEGVILIDDMELNNENIRVWRKSVGFVPQDPIILNKSIKENITRFNPGATDEEIITALEKSQALDFINKLPDGVDTLMGNKGARLSGGEKQRIALARAIVRKPSVLVLDEATSALDDENEKSIQKTIQSLKESVTIVIIAHRKSTIENADCVINVENGGNIQVCQKN